MTQDEFVTKLFDDLMFSPSQKRAWLLEEYGVKFADELTTARKSALIDKLSKMRDNKQKFVSRFKRETIFGEEE